VASGQWAGSTRRSTLPADWMRRRNHVLKRDQRMCRIKGPMCIGTATEVDHVGSRDDHRTEMLRAACHPCHLDRSSSQGGAALGQQRKKIAAARRRPPESHPGVL
jgi:5-methylcytosine-specific restriction endonuclease McrA